MTFENQTEKKIKKKTIVSYFSEKQLIISIENLRKINLSWKWMFFYKNKLLYITFWGENVPLPTKEKPLATTLFP